MSGKPFALVNCSTSPLGEMRNKSASPRADPHRAALVFDNRADSIYIIARRQFSQINGFEFVFRFSVYKPRRLFPPKFARSRLQIRFENFSLSDCRAKWW